jgi:beta-phosphoglucomutase-like phosphatase (HAD superfamily)
MSDESKRVLILDFDGVVVETEPLHFASWNAACQELLNVQIPGDHRQLVGLSLAQIYALWAGAAKSPIHLSAELRRELLARKTELFFKMGQSTLKPMDGLIPLVRCAQENEWLVAIASRALRARLLRTLEILDLPLTFDLVYGSEDAVNPTTDRKNHARAALALGASPANCIVIEDSASGIRDACACGIGHVIGFTSSLSADELTAAGAHAVVDHLADWSILRRMSQSRGKEASS